MRCWAGHAPTTQTEQQNDGGEIDKVMGRVPSLLDFDQLFGFDGTVKTFAVKTPEDILEVFACDNPNQIFDSRSFGFQTRRTAFTQARAAHHPASTSEG